MFQYFRPPDAQHHGPTCSNFHPGTLTQGSACRWVSQWLYLLNSPQMKGGESSAQTGLTFPLWLNEVQHLAEQVLEGQWLYAHHLHALTLLLIEEFQLVHGQHPVPIQVHAAEPVLDAGNRAGTLQHCRGHPHCTDCSSAHLLPIPQGSSATARHKPRDDKTCWAGSGHRPANTPSTFCWSPRLLWVAQPHSWPVSPAPTVHCAAAQAGLTYGRESGPAARVGQIEPAPSPGHCRDPGEGQGSCVMHPFAPLRHKDTQGELSGSCTPHPSSPLEDWGLQFWILLLLLCIRFLVLTLTCTSGSLCTAVSPWLYKAGHRQVLQRATVKFSHKPSLHTQSICEGMCPTAASTSGMCAQSQCLMAWGDQRHWWLPRYKKLQENSASMQFFRKKGKWFDQPSPVRCFLPNNLQTLSCSLL